MFDRVLNTSLLWLIWFLVYIILEDFMGQSIQEWTKWNLLKIALKKLKWYGLLKAVFYKFHLVHSWIFCPIFLFTRKKNFFQSRIDPRTVRQHCVCTFTLSKLSCVHVNLNSRLYSAAIFNPIVSVLERVRSKIDCIGALYQDFFGQRGSRYYDTDMRLSLFKIFQGSV